MRSLEPEGITVTDVALKEIFAPILINVSIKEFISDIRKIDKGTKCNDMKIKNLNIENFNIFRNTSVTSLVKKYDSTS